jgi:hypothetical protein
MSDVEETPATDGQTAVPEEVSIVDAPTPDAQTAFLAETNAHSASTKRGWIIGGIVLAVLLVAAIGWALWPKPKPVDTAAKPAAATPSAPVSAVTSSTLSTAAVPGSALSTSAAEKPGATKRPTSPGAAPGTPGTPAAPGDKLVEIAAPPEKTIGMLVVPKGFTPATYGVVLQPFGWGPGGQAAGRLVAKIVSATPTNDSAKSLGKDFAGRNVSLWIAPPAAKVMVIGGTYQGVMEVKPQGDVGVLYLATAKRVK